jgi:hypothetical protein
MDYHFLQSGRFWPNAKLGDATQLCPAPEGHGGG